MSMKRWSQRVEDSIHLWEMEMNILLSDMRFDADDVSVRAGAGRPVHVQAGVKKSESGAVL